VTKQTPPGAIKHESQIRARTSTSSCGVSCLVMFYEPDQRKCHDLWLKINKMINRNKWFPFTAVLIFAHISLRHFMNLCGIKMKEKHPKRWTHSSGLSSWFRCVSGASGPTMCSSMQVFSTHMTPLGSSSSSSSSSDSSLLELLDSFRLFFAFFFLDFLDLLQKKEM